MKKVIRKIHRWLGFPLGVLFFITLLSGILVGFDDYIGMLKHVELEHSELSDAELANAIAVLKERHDGIRQIIFPKEDMAVFTVTERGAKFYYDPNTLQLIEQESTRRSALFSFILSIHRHFLLGRTEYLGLSGAEWVAWCGLLAVVISLIGVYLWWPSKRTFKVKRLVPTKHKISDYYFSHLSGGIVTVVFIVLFSLTGAGITYRTIARDLLLEETREIQSFTPVYSRYGWQGAVSQAKEVFPDAELTSVRFGGRRTPAQYEGAAQFRFNTSADWLGYSGSIVYIDTDNGAYLGHSAFADHSLGEKLYELILPLHIGLGLSPFYLLSMLIAMSLALIMVVGGVTSFVMKKSKYEKKIVAAVSKTVTHFKTDLRGSK